jgi:predicted Co/Zn/Cd cation transporter (cation efflux family)
MVKERLASFLSKKFILAVAGFVVGVLQTAGVFVDEGTVSIITGAVVAVASAVAYFIANVDQKKAEMGTTVALSELDQE